MVSCAEQAPACSYIMQYYASACMGHLSFLWLPTQYRPHSSRDTQTEMKKTVFYEINSKTQKRRHI
jgi:hypothetical protein